MTKHQIRCNSIAILFFFICTLTSNAQSIILGRPTDNSITANILFSYPAEFYIEYGTSSGTYTTTINTINNVPDVAEDVDINNLNIDTKYYYRLRYKTVGSATFLASPEYTFHTARSSGSSFSFTVEADEHLYDKKGVDNLYRICLENQSKDHPDFMLSLGDIFGDDHNPDSISAYQVDSLHKNYLPFLSTICNSVPFYVCLGNHEGENDYYYGQNPPNNLAIWATLSRKSYFPNPYPNSFYSGNTNSEPYGIGYPENYYSWTWGNALFVVLDVYRDQCDTSPKPTNWAWSLGAPQYNWLKTTLQNSNAQFKFVFAHHNRGEGRGGIVPAKLFEWGGYEQNGTTWGFTNKRPGWAMPIQQLFVTYGVNVFFQGHDHLFAHEVLDGVTYQEVPMPSDSTYEIGMLANSAYYTSDTLNGSGHIRVTVSQDCAQVDYIRAYLPADTLSGLHHNGEVAFSYTVGSCATGIENPINTNVLPVFPNPADDHINYSVKQENYESFLFNNYGQLLSHDYNSPPDIKHINSGMYILKVVAGKSIYTQKLIISHQ